MTANETTGDSRGRSREVSGIEDVLDQDPIENYRTANEHVHLGEWCAPCVTQGREYERSLTGNGNERPAPSTPAGDGLREALDAAIESYHASASSDPEDEMPSWVWLASDLRDRLAASQPRNEDGLDVERLARALRVQDGVLEGWEWESQQPEGWRHRQLAERVAAEYAAQSGEAAGEGEGRG